MSDILVCYSSNYGATQWYAEHIARELNAELKDIRMMRAQEMLNYDTVIFGSAWYAGWLSNSKLVAANQGGLLSRKLIIFTCGICDPEDESVFAEMQQNLQKMFSPRLLAHTQFFYFRGRLDIDKLRLPHSMAAKKLLKQLSALPETQLSHSQQQILRHLLYPASYLNRKAIIPLLQAARSNVWSFPMQPVLNPQHS
jgi:menaquinone-dependent protoporphyrinogen IX oxidase